MDKEQRDAIKSVGDWHRSLTNAVMDADEKMTADYLYWLAQSVKIAARKLGVDLDRDIVEMSKQYEAGVLS